MTTETLKTRLAAILMADVQGFSRLVGEDEAWAIRTLQSYKEVLATHILENNGRVVEAVGDKILAEFASAVDAVQAAVGIQKELKNRNGNLPGNRRMVFRIGVNLGDVTDEGGKISGDGVQVAVKVETMSAAGGVSISGAAHDFVKNKLPLVYQYLGTQSVKNIEKPVRIYRVLIEPTGFSARASIWKGAAVRQWERLNPAVKVLIALAAIANGVWHVYPWITGSPLPIASRQSTAAKSSDKSLKLAKIDPSDVASKDRMAFPLPDKPSIAVLPFANRSEDPKQGFFCDAITESIIIALSKVPGMFVIASNSTFVYKGKPVKIKQVSEELGVRYILEGSVQRSADRLRITVQLVDALTGQHLWAERYDREVKDIFALQDEITLKVLMATQVKLTGGGKVPKSGKYFRGKQGLDCYLKIQEGIGHAKNLSLADNNLSRQIAEEALAMCPEVPSAYYLVAWVHSNDYWLGTTKSRQGSIEQAIKWAQKAVALDDSSVEGHSILSVLYNQKREYGKSMAEVQRAMALNPSGAGPIYVYAYNLVNEGRSKEAIPLFQQALRLNPYCPPNWHHNFGHALWFAQRFAEAVPQFKKVIQLVPNHNTAHAWLAITYLMLGRETEARAEAEEHLRINPKFSVDTFAKTRVYKEQSETDRLVAAMRRVGLK